MRKPWWLGLLLLWCGPVLAQVPTPFISFIQPNTGLQSGGNTVTITGLNFGTPTVSVNNTYYATVYSNSATLITYEAPAVPSAGVYTVQENNGTSTSNNVYYKYNAANTFTPTFTSTPTNSPTNTPTNTFTNTPVLTYTPTNTPTKTNTPTNTFTSTNTNTVTNTPTPTINATYVPYVGANGSVNLNSQNLLAGSLSISGPVTLGSSIWSGVAQGLTGAVTTFQQVMGFTNGLISTIGPTNTPTVTSTVTKTPTSTPTNTITNTPTNTPTNTITNTITNTPTNTPTNTITNTITNTPTNTPTNTITNTITNTPTNTPTATWTSVVLPGNANTTWNNPAGPPTVGPTFTPGSGGGGTGPVSVIIAGQECEANATVVVSAGGALTCTTIPSSAISQITPGDWVTFFKATPVVGAGTTINGIPIQVSAVISTTSFACSVPSVTPSAWTASSQLFVSSVEKQSICSNFSNKISYFNPSFSGDTMSMTIGFVNNQPTSLYGSVITSSGSIGVTTVTYNNGVTGMVGNINTTTAFSTSSILNFIWTFFGLQ